MFSVESVTNSLPVFHTNVSKPAGASATQKPKVTTSSPDLSVTILDAVTMKVLYRVTHAGADFRHCVVTDNAVYYTYFNTAHKR